MKKKILRVFAFFIAITILSGIFVPRSNPPIENTVAWDSQATHDQFMKSCADCHSNQTQWPWYSYIGPTAFMVWNNVNEGREHFNISMANMGESNESGEEVIEGNMPPWDYLLMHGDASLNDAERKAFARGLDVTFGRKGDNEND